MKKKTLKKIIFISAFLFLCLILLVLANLYIPGKQSTDNEQNVTQVESNASMIEVNLHLETILVEGNKVQFSIGTNLPSGTELMLTLSNDSYTKKSKITISSEGTISEVFSKDGGALDKGSYKLSVSMLSPSLQPDYVREIIGERGENIAGKHVLDSNVDINEYNYVSAEFDVTI